MHLTLMALLPFRTSSLYAPQGQLPQRVVSSVGHVEWEIQQQPLRR